MNTEWLVAKYIPDLRRREPRNIGVLLRTGDVSLARFVGERSSGFVDGRYLRGRVADVATYKAWVEYWRHELGDEADLRELVTSRPDDNYVVEYGGSRLFGRESTEPTEMLEYLYTTLVEELPEGGGPLSVSELSESVLSLAGIADRVTRGYELDIPHERFSDKVVFDYRYENGRPHLMQQVSLTFGDDRSWTLAHAAAWAFEKAYEAEERSVSLIALVKPRRMDDDLEGQLLLLEEHSSVVDLKKPEVAAASLRALVQPATREDPFGPP
jgi:hypothetical protein